MADDELERFKWQWRSIVLSKFGPPDPSTRLVLVAIAQHMWKGKQSAFPGQQLIAECSGLSVRSVQVHLDIASSKRWIRIKERKRRGQVGVRNEYFPLIPKRALKRWELYEESAYRQRENSARSQGEESAPREVPQRADDAAQHADSASPTRRFCKSDTQNLRTKQDINQVLKHFLNISDRTIEKVMRQKHGITREDLLAAWGAWASEKGREFDNVDKAFETFAHTHQPTDEQRKRAAAETNGAAKEFFERHRGRVKPLESRQ